MSNQLLLHGQEAIRKGLAWLNSHEGEIAGLADLSAHYKAPYLYAAVGDGVTGRRYANWMARRYLQPDGDFRTQPKYKGWGHLPISPANRYLYSNGWIIVGLRRLGCYGLARHGLEFTLHLQDPKLGGFYSRYDPKTGQPDRRYLDSSSTSSAGLALLACGREAEARQAGEFILRMLEEQPEPERFFYSSWEAGEGLMTEVWGDEDQNALRGRKQFCLSTEADPLAELTWLAGKPMKFLAKLYDQTGEKRYLDGAICLFDFFHRLGQERWHNYASCKILWAGAELYRHTGEPRFAETAGRILEWFCDSQYPSGLWVHTLWYRGPEDQPLAASLDLVQELCAEMADTLFELGG